MRKLILTNGAETDLARPHTATEICELIGAEILSVVLLRDRVHVMLVDDLGHDKNLLVNEKATAHYLAKCRPGTTYQIRGDVVIAPDSDFAS